MDLKTAYTNCITKFKKPKNIFFLIIILFAAVSVIVALVSGFSWQMSHLWLLDFAAHIKYVEGDLSKVYYQSVHAVFPPFAYIIYFLIGLMFKNVSMLTADVENWTNGDEFYAMPYLLVAVVCIVSMFIVFNKICGRNNMVGLLFSVVFGTMFIHSFRNGNSAFWVLVILLWALYLKDSDNKKGKILALVLFAIASGFKIYACVFGLLYLKEKRWKEAGMLLGMGLVIFFLPFVFTGGFDGLVQYFKNNMNVGTSFTDNTRPAIISIPSFIYAINSNAHPATLIVVTLMFAAWTFLILIFGKLEYWKVLVLICTFITACAPVASHYVLIYFIIPLVFYFKENFREGFRAKPQDYIYMVLFAVVFALWPHDIVIAQTVEKHIYLLLVSVVLIEGTVLVIKRAFANGNAR